MCNEKGQQVIILGILSSSYIRLKCSVVSGVKGQVSRGEEGTSFLWDYCVVYRVSSLLRTHAEPALQHCIQLL